MAKKRKTRKQKLSADIRRETTLESTPMHTYAPTFVATAPESQIVPRTVTHAISTINYEYLKVDLRKTLVVTGAIILLQLVLFLVTKGS